MVVRWHRIIGMVGAWTLLFACTKVPEASPSAGAEPVVSEGQMTLFLPRSPAAGEAAHLKVTAGVLPAKAQVVVRLPNGKIVGTVSPYGLRKDQEAGAFLLPLPAEVSGEREVRLELQLGGEGIEKRAPSADEIKTIEIVYIPVTPP